MKKTIDRKRVLELVELGIPYSEIARRVGCSSPLVSSIAIKNGHRKRAPIRTPSIASRVSVAEAKAGLAALLRRAERGESIVICRHGKAVAHLVRVSPHAEENEIALEKFSHRLDKIAANRLPPRKVRT